jgi:hypothetical protein
MKTSKTELDVDFIGGQGSLTIAEEKALSAFFKERKSAPKKITSKKRSTTKRSKVNA